MTTWNGPRGLSDLADQHWMDNALCAQVDADLWFPEQGGASAPAKRICNACPVQADCLEYALKIGAAGIWGGTSENERRRLRRARPALCSIQHGTDAGAREHYRRGEPACETCRRAARVAHRERQLRRAQ